jgi:hypothetical protein
VLKDNFYFEKTNISKKTGLYSLQADTVKDIQRDKPAIAKEMDSLLSAYYHATKYLYFNNKKESQPK